MCNARTKKNRRKGISILELTHMFPDDNAAEKWFEDMRWPDGEKHCPRCDSIAISLNKGTANNNPYRCKDCRTFFSVKLGTVMQSTKLGYQTWAFGIYLLSTSLKGTSSMKIHRDLGITQKTAWLLSHKIRSAFGGEGLVLSNDVEIDEAYMGGLEKNKHTHKKLKAGRGPVGKTAVIGMKERGGKIKAQPIANVNMETTHAFVKSGVVSGSQLYTDDARHWTAGIKGYKHASVNHSAKEYVDGKAHTNGIESFWALLKRGYHGTHHYMSPKHLHRYVNEFAGRHNVRDLDTLKAMTALAGGMVGKQLPYKKLVA